MNAGAHILIARAVRNLGPAQNLRLIEDVEEIRNEEEILREYRMEASPEVYEEWLRLEREAARKLPRPPLPS